MAWSPHLSFTASGDLLPYLRPRFTPTIQVGTTVYALWDPSARRVFNPYHVHVTFVEHLDVGPTFFLPGTVLGPAAPPTWDAPAPPTQARTVLFRATPFDLSPFTSCTPTAIEHSVIIPFPLSTPPNTSYNSYYSTFSNGQ
jgi:hypothetical protein